MARRRSPRRRSIMPDPRDVPAGVGSLIRADERASDDVDRAHLRTVHRGTAGRFADDVADLALEAQFENVEAYPVDTGQRWLLNDFDAHVPRKLSFAERLRSIDANSCNHLSTRCSTTDDQAILSRHAVASGRTPSITSAVDRVL